MGHKISLLGEYLAQLCKHHKVCMAVSRNHHLHKVLVLGSHTDHTFTASVLSRIAVSGTALNVAGVRKSYETSVAFDQVLKHDLGAVEQLLEEVAP